jgi:SPP1 gp7 family putative phage head morphogenesis protein
LLAEELDKATFDFSNFMRRWQDEKLPMLSESRVRLIFEQNMNTAQQAAQYTGQQMPGVREMIVGYVYHTVEDSEVRPEHAALNGKVFAPDSPALDNIWPPNGFNCRCWMETIYDFDERAPGIKYDGPDDVRLPTDTTKEGVEYDFNRNVGQILLKAKNERPGGSSLVELMR